MAATKYQIFISSTYNDLKAERDQVIKACLEMGHIPVGMEMFSAADEEQWKIIQRQIDESDYYVVIVAHRYGSMVEGVSYTEKEYDYAIAQGIPVLGFVIDASAQWTAAHVETDAKILRCLNAFKAKVKKKPVAFWTNADDLHSKCAIALMKTFNTQPRPGWTRATGAVSIEVTEELSRLSSENAKLRKQVASLQVASAHEQYAQGNDTLQIKMMTSGEIIASYDFTWDEIIKFAFERVIIGMNEEDIFEGLKKLFNDRHKSASAHKQYRYPNLEDGIFTKIRAQVIALGYIEIKQKKIYDFPSTYWELTSAGKAKYAELVAIRRSLPTSD